MARVTCITMHRNEDVLLEPWLGYHGYPFGFENIFRFEHRSVHPKLLATLDCYEQLGARSEGALPLGPNQRRGL